MAERSNLPRGRAVRAAVVVVAVGALVWLFPLFRIRPLPSTGAGPTTGTAAFDPRATAEAVWRERILPGAGQAAELGAVARAVRSDAAAARSTFGKPAGVGVDYFFVRGSGKVVARLRNVVHVAVEGASDELVALRLGPVFGNTVRDGTGLLDLNSFPGLQEFNTVAAELNALVEARVQPALRERAQVGSLVVFAGCAEVPETAADPGQPLFTVVPVQAEVR